MRQVTTLPGIRLLLIIGVPSLLVAAAATAAPTYPVNRATETRYIISYEPSSYAQAPGTSTADAIGADTSAVDDATTDATTVDADPSGDMNHGQVVRQIPEVVEGRLLGCVVRTIAQSDLGKDDGHLLSDGQSTSTDATAPISPSLLETECSKSGPSGKPTPANASQHGPDDRPSPNSKSKDAPGKKK